MKSKWQDFERIIAAIHAATHGAAAVTWNDEINGRQFDVVVRFKSGMHDYLTVIECKDYASKVSVEKVDAFATKSRDANAHKAVIVAANGFQSGCIEVARRHGITLLSLHEAVDKSKEPTVGQSEKVFNVYRVRLVIKETGQELEFEEWNGKLEYLMEQCILVDDSGSKTASEVIEEWRRSEKPQTDENESRFEVVLPPETIAVIPFEEPVEVSALRFHCKDSTAFVTGEGFLTRHIREFEVLQHELHDCITGGAVFKISKSEIDLSFDSTLEVGKFYLGMNGTFSFYCFELVNDEAIMLLLESYQHGRLIQVKYAQKLEHIKDYVEVEDENKLKHLQKMLDAWSNPKK